MKRTILSLAVAASLMMAASACNSTRNVSDSSDSTAVDSTAMPTDTMTTTPQDTTSVPPATLPPDTSQVPPPQ